MRPCPLAHGLILFLPRWPCSVLFPYTANRLTGFESDHRQGAHHVSRESTAVQPAEPRWRERTALVTKSSCGTLAGQVARRRCAAAARPGPLLSKYSPSSHRATSIALHPSFLSGRPAWEVVQNLVSSRRTMVDPLRVRSWNPHSEMCHVEPREWARIYLRGMLRHDERVILLIG